MKIKEATKDELGTVLNIHRLAFGEEDEAELVNRLVKDDTAKPLLSLTAFLDKKAVGHILFTKVTISDKENLKAQILAPLAILPEHQKQGIGRELIIEGLRKLKERETDLVFVLGYPEYYLKFGFEPAERLGLKAPYPIAKKNADAWMVKRLSQVEAKGKVKCCKSLDKEEYWVE